MTIYLICVNPENGKCLAISTEDHTIQAVSYTSEECALGELVRSNPGIRVDQVFHIDTSEK